MSDRSAVRAWFRDHAPEHQFDDDEIDAALAKGRAYRDRFGGNAGAWKHPGWMEAVIHLLHARRVSIRATAKLVGLSHNAVASRTHPTRRLELYKAAAAFRAAHRERD